MPKSSTPLAALVATHVDQLVAALERTVRDQIHTALTTYFHQALAGKPRARRGRPGRPKARRLLPCIAPKCAKPSKGPRFHYLCEDHRKASRADYTAWRDASRAKAKRKAG